MQRPLKTRYVRGVGKYLAQIRVARGILRGATHRYGITRGVKRLTQYLKHPQSLLSETPSRFVLHDGDLFVVPDLPPISSPAFVSVLLDHVHAVTTGAPDRLVLAILSVSSACPYRCAYCYAADAEHSDRIPLESLETAIEAFLARGIRTIHLSGGEPATRFDDLCHILARFREREVLFWLLTTGRGLDPSRLRHLRALGLTGIMVGLDAPSEARMDAIKRVPGAWRAATECARAAAVEGLLVGINSVVDTSILQQEVFLRHLSFAGDLGACFVNLYPPKSPPHKDLRAGASPGGSSIGYAPFTAAQYTRLHKLSRTSRTSLRYAHLPLAYTPDTWEARQGCTGGRHFVYVNTLGEVQPCPFIGISFGNIVTDPMDEIFTNLRSSTESWRCATNQMLTEHAQGRGNSDG